MTHSHNGGNADLEQRQLLQKYANQITILTDELTHYENEISVKEWNVRSLEEKLKQARHEAAGLQQDFTLEAERAKNLELICAELQSKVDQFGQTEQQLQRELQLLRHEKRNVSDRIRDSYVQLTSRRRISEQLRTQLAPENNSDDESVYPVNAPQDEPQDELSFEEWDGSDTESNLAAQDPEIVITAQPLLLQYETLISNLQLENERLVEQLQAMSRRNHPHTGTHPRCASWFVHETCPFHLLRPAYLLLWQPWALPASSQLSELNRNTEYILAFEEPYIEQEIAV